MGKEPNIKVEDLPKDDEELVEEELEGVAGGMINATFAAKKGSRLARASDPDSGEEVV